MPVAIKDYLESKGFHRSPFATTNAEQEAAVLPSFFVRVEWFDWLVGDPRDPQSLILFAPQGYGKTSHRLEVARLASERVNAPALVVTISDAGLLLTPTGEHLSLSGYVDVLRRLVLIHLDEHLSIDPASVQKLRTHPPSADYFQALLHLYAPLSALDISTGSITQYIAAFKQATLGTHEWLKVLSRLAQSAGFASIYVLIDGVDELHQTRHNPGLMADMLRPLLDAPNILQECGFAFKFFLPQILESYFIKHDIGRLDRMPYRSLKWTDEQLLQMFSQRLSSYSRISETDPVGRISAFHMLCETDITYDVDLRLVQAAHSSPRMLLDLARRIVEQHCSRTASIQELIPSSVIEEVLGSVQESSHHTQETSAAIDAQLDTRDQDVPLATDEATTLQSLFFDAQVGEVRLGDKRTPLNGQLLTVMGYLWEHRTRLVRYEELETAVYGNNLSEREDPRGSLRRLVGRLRSKFQDGQTASRDYIDVRDGVGYQLKNWQDYQ